MLLNAVCLLAAGVAVVRGQAVGPAVFAHFMVGNTAGYDVAQWQKEMSTAQEASIDGFALNVGTPLSDFATQIQNAFDAAAAQPGDFKLFFSFDYQGGADGPWPIGDVETVLRQYAPKDQHYKVNGAALVSTFAGEGNASDWTTIPNDIKADVPGGIYFVPDWVNFGPVGIMDHADVIQGAFSWDMWPDGPKNITDDHDLAWKGALTGKSFMMGVSPWFYTNLPGYHKAFVWRGDDMWHTRWMQVMDVKPQFVEIVTWNDYGESHYINDIWEQGIAVDSQGNSAAKYVDGFPHAGWRSLLPYYISMYKNNAAPPVTEEIIQYWYRLAPAAQGNNQGVTGNNCQSPINIYGYQQCYNVPDILEDGVFLTALVESLPATITLKIGDDLAGSWEASQVGLNHYSAPFAGKTGNVTVAIERDSNAAVTGTGPAIMADWSSNGGNAIYNAWVGTASSGASPSKKRDVKNRHKRT
ncbi:MAG: hypothetical protein M1820_002909 [Bogoriella megaspora]|nr:MAG: hypothetical protein M1820_002909 [Bogoriella megaspora]